MENQEEVGCWEVAVWGEEGCWEVENPKEVVMEGVDAWTSDKEGVPSWVVVAKLEAVGCWEVWNLRE